MKKINKTVIEKRYYLITDAELNHKFNQALSTEQLEDLISEFDNAKFNLFRQEKEIMKLRSQLRSVKERLENTYKDLDKAEDSAEKYQIWYQETQVKGVA